MIRRIRSLLVTLPVFLAFVGGGAAADAVSAGPAWAAATGVGPTCSFDGSTVTATFAAPGSGFGIEASLYQVPSDGGELIFDQGGKVDCGATISNAAHVVVIGTSDLDYFAVDESQPDFTGSLPPIDAQLGAGSNVLIGRGIPNQANTITLGKAAMVINGTVVTYTGVTRGELHGGNMNGDVLSARGGGPAGGVFTEVALIVAGKGAATLRGGDGPDVIVGDSDGRGDLIVGGMDGDSIQGSTGADDINGGSGDDVIDGQAGDDRIRGMMGDDDLTGWLGSDRLLGGGGSDTIYAGDGVKDKVNGGPDGTNGDTADVDCGTDKVSKIEFVNCV